MKELVLSYADPEMWRSEKERKQFSKSEWRQLREKILIKYNYTCQYCSFRAEKHQIVHHIDGNPNNNDLDNLEPVCPMCSLINHSGQGCDIQGVVDLYRKSKYNQSEIVQITRKMRAEGKSDDEIINYLGLEGKMPFKMDWEYLEQLYGFITSRKADQPYTNVALFYGYEEERKRKTKTKRGVTLESFG